MSKAIRLVMVAGLLQFALATSASAVVLPFDNTVDWNSSSTPGTPATTYSEFSDTSVPTWNHNISFSPSATSILTAFLEIRHQGNGQYPAGGPCNNTFEVWFLESSSSVQLGNLSCSVPNWTVDTFAVPSSLFPSLPASSWTLSLRLGESTGTPTDVIRLDYAKLYGTYESVPEPGTLALLGLGLLGLGLSPRRRAN